jgi:uncharacterized membrane protein YhiD involved in acid resistance
MRICDWFNIVAVATPATMLFSMAFGIFAGPAMSPQAEVFWIIGTIVMALLVWFSGAKAQKREREAKQHEMEAKQHERAELLRFDELKQLIAKPETTLEDVRIAAAVGESAVIGIGISDALQGEITKADRGPS